MWRIRDVKNLGRNAARKNYWVSFAVVFTLMILGVASVVPATVTYKFDDFGFTFRTLSYFRYMNPVAIAALVICAFIAVLLIVVVAILVTAYFLCPLTVGSAKYFLDANADKADAGNLFFAFKKGQFKTIVRATFFKNLFIFLWSLLLVIPGIIKSYQWRLVEYIMVDNPTMKAWEARELSKKLMKGNKWKTFVFDLSFIGWDLLSIITFGIVTLFWVEPFRMHSNAALYSAIKPAEKKSSEKAVSAKAAKKSTKKTTKKTSKKTTK